MPTSSCDSKGFEIRTGLKELWSYFFAMCLQQDFQATCLYAHQLSALKGTGRLSTGKVHCRSSHLASAKHYGRVQSKKEGWCYRLFMDLIAAYVTVWHRGLTCKLLKLLSDKHMIRLIMKLVQNKSLTLPP